MRNARSRSSQRQPHLLRGDGRLTDGGQWGSLGPSPLSSHNTRPRSDTDSNSRTSIHLERITGLTLYTEEKDNDRPKRETGASIPPETMMHFPPVSDSPLFHKNF